MILNVCKVMILLLFQIQQLTLNDIAEGIGVEFNLTSIRMGSTVTASIPAASLRQLTRSKRSTDNDTPTTFAFYAILLSQRFTLNSSQNTSEVKLFLNIYQKLYEYCIKQ